MEAPAALQTFESLGIALAIGLLIGVERGWTQRDLAEGDRVAGLRTFGLIGLLGGALALFGEGSPVLLATGFVALAALVVAAHWRSAPGIGDYGITTEVAALVTYVLAALSVTGEPAVAAAGAVVAAAMLGLKQTLHDGLKRLRQFELMAGIHLALISLVVLPVLPSEGFGPWGVFNPYQLWLMVVLISAISFAGHFAVRIAGARRGLLLTGLFAGLAASTALTLSFSRMGRDRPVLQPALAAGVIVAGTTMFPRILLEVAVVNAAMVAQIVVPLAVLTLIGLAGAIWLWRRQRERPAGDTDEDVTFRRPFELRSAIQFAVALALILFLAEAARRTLGDSGIYAVALISGLTDVDAITLSLSKMATDDLAETVAVRGILLAALANTAVKGGMVAVICGGTMARQVLGLYAVMATIGLIFVGLTGMVGVG